MAGHILKNYDEELDDLKDQVLSMGRKVIASMDQAFAGLMEGDREKCADTIDDDEIIDAQEKAIDEQGMSILLRFNPVASDLRMVLSSINVCRSLERIGDHVVNIAKQARKLLKKGTVPEVRLIDPLHVEARKIVKAALISYSDIDEEAAHDVIAMDRKVDDIHKALSKSLSAKVSDEENRVDALLNLLFMSRSLERIGDLAVNIAEDVVFITSAEDIRHS